jgi:hypothetical protein
MHTLYALYRFLTSKRARLALDRVGLELKTLALALARPGSFVTQGQAMRALHVEAERIESTHPVRAEALRRQAATIGWR